MLVNIGLNIIGTFVQVCCVRLTAINAEKVKKDVRHFSAKSNFIAGEGSHDLELGHYPRESLFI